MEISYADDHANPKCAAQIRFRSLINVGSTAHLNKNPELMV